MCFCEHSRRDSSMRSRLDLCGSRGTFAAVGLTNCESYATLALLTIPGEVYRVLEHSMNTIPGEVYRVLEHIRMGDL